MKLDALGQGGASAIRDAWARYTGPGPAAAAGGGSASFGPPSYTASASETCRPGYIKSKSGSGITARYQCIHDDSRPAAPTYTPPPPPPAPVITVAPVMQQSFDPQFSPVLQQQQDSPGATQAAQPVQSKTSPQTATSAPSGISESEMQMREEIARLRAMEEMRASAQSIPMETAGPPPMPVESGGPLPAAYGFYDGPPAPQPMAVPAQSSSVVNKYYPYAIIAALAVGGLVLMNKRGKSKR